METPQSNQEEIIPELLERDIKVESVLGRGGMGTVYRGRHLKLDRIVAVKIINPEVANNKDINQRFEREARLMAKLRHPNAALIYDFGTLPDGRLFIVMEFVEGVSLSEVLEKEGKLPREKVVDIAVSICEVLSEAHSLGIVHRDLKPANIMLNEKGVFVLDFGIAKMLDTTNETLNKSMTAVGTLVGTPYYMSPEQCLGEKLDGRSDLYSLGALIYEMLSGNPPFDGEVVSAIIIKHATAEALPLQDLGENIPVGLSDAVKQLLAKKPEDRPANADIAKELLLNSLSVTEKPTAQMNNIQTSLPKITEAPTQQMNQVTMPIAGKTFTQTDSSQNSKSSVGFGKTAFALSLLGIVVLVGGIWFVSSFLKGESEAAQNNSNRNNSDQKLAADPYASSKNDPYAKDSMENMNHDDMGMMTEDDYTKNVDAADSNNAQSVPILSSEEADKVLTFITNTTYHRADGMQIIKTPTDTALVCLHNMFEQGKTHTFVVERPNPNSQWQVTGRVSLDTPDFKSQNWNFEPEDVDGDGFEDVVFTAENKDKTKKRSLIYVPRTRQNYWVLASNSENGKSNPQFSPNAEIAKAESFKKRLLRSIGSN